MECLHDFRHEAALVIHGDHSLLAAAVDQRFGGINSIGALSLVSCR